MDRILNKILCFMWGCQSVEHFGTVFVRVQGEVYEHMITVVKCKHCGAHKHD